MLKMPCAGEILVKYLNKNPIMIAMCTAMKEAMTPLCRFQRYWCSVY